MLYIALVILSYFFMEFIAWSNHKYIMHGFLWNWHKDHHLKDAQPDMPLKTEGKKFEKNDLFFIVYALPGIILMVTGFLTGNKPMIFIALGITLYGLTYFIIHDIIIHKRLNIGFLHKNSKFFIRGIIKAHLAHHKPNNKRDFQNYGLLIFPLRFFKN